MELDKETATPFSEVQACRYFRQLILAVEFLHANNIVHRDIKPENILLCTKDDIKLADFGVSHICFDQDDTLTKTAGTPAFQAPEAVNVQGLPYEGKPVDIWAMGVTLYCFLFATPPFFNAVSQLDLQRMIRDVEPSYESRSVLDVVISLFIHLDRYIDVDLNR